MITPLLLLLSTLPATEDPFSIELSVRESANVSRRDEAISGGIPLPLGEFSRDQTFVLQDQRGREIACQVVPLVVESDDSLRWILLDFQDSVAAGAVQHYTLRPGPPTVQPGARIQIVQSEGQWQIDTGA
ncbi:MAG: hypothetical protein JJ992_25725, partial [Planctomycetes bacterium]|nr:hypothetical protein [Planctomycetota bacterium]